MRSGRSLSTPTKSASRQRAATVRLDVAGFYSDYQDLQVSYTTFVPPTNVAVVSLQQVPKAEVYGIEGSLEYAPVDDFTVRAGATWLHARYGDDAVFVGSSVNVAGTGFNVNSDPLKVFPNQGAVAMDISDKQMARAPDLTAFLGLDYLIGLGGVGGVRLAANAKYTDSYVVTNPSLWGGEPLAAYNARRAVDPNALPNNNAILAGTPYADRSGDQRAVQDSYVLLNASITWSDPSDKYYVRLWGNNLSDETYRVHYNPSSSTYSPVGEPRTYGVTAGYKFWPPNLAGIAIDAPDRDSLRSGALRGQLERQVAMLASALSFAVTSESIPAFQSTTRLLSSARAALLRPTSSADRIPAGRKCHRSRQTNVWRSCQDPSTAGSAL